MQAISYGLCICYEAESGEEISNGIHQWVQIIGLSRFLYHTKLPVIFLIKGL